MYFLLSALMLYFTSLFASVYSVCALAFSALVRLLFRAVFFSFLFSTFFSDCTDIHSFLLCLCGPSTSLHRYDHWLSCLLPPCVSNLSSCANSDVSPPPFDWCLGCHSSPSTVDWCDRFLLLCPSVLNRVQSLSTNLECRSI